MLAASAAVLPQWRENKAYMSHCLAAAVQMEANVKPNTMSGKTNRCALQSDVSKGQEREVEVSF